ncbi:DUF262 domain-containing protein [Hymenobacter guriensis]|uniref:DUF262 domain-containing protein n=1 Tax=Hymenobacter guriensis TaxID=2793065 RepID=A0ABS0L4D1_9BACT|nr:DUF262 domain-containing protein [Hymenobacter guriensis]MBG8554994.1 DUF262 domain-containing protein [Hymenobacter guriensis]
MATIEGKTRTVRELLKSKKYEVDYYQRGYKWQEKQMQELITDLTSQFADQYNEEDGRSAVRNYNPYFLGSIIVSDTAEGRFLVDGQQRLTSLTLLLLYLRRLQAERSDRVNVDELIYSEVYGEKSFNLNVPARQACMNALFEGETIEVTPATDESVRNLLARYENLSQLFPEELKGAALPYFIDWLLENVKLVEITTDSDENAYTIFETMNDRGLSLTPTEMLKSYLLANIPDTATRQAAETAWKDEIARLLVYGKDTQAELFKTWLRSQYADNIRERSRGAAARDFERIGTEYHRWVREKDDKLQLTPGADTARFIQRDFLFYSRWYRALLDASRSRTTGLETVFYNAQQNFTLQYLVLLATLRPTDPDDVARRKLELTARYLDVLLSWRVWCGRSIGYATMQYAMFLAAKRVRGKDEAALAIELRAMLAEIQETPATGPVPTLNQQNRKSLHRLLARLTDYLETHATDHPGRYPEYVNSTGGGSYEVEHIWANHPEDHADEFPQKEDFRQHRNRIGGLLLLPKSFNASYGDLAYSEKLPHYFGQNLLAKSLNPNCYEHHPRFTNWVQHTGLPFVAYPTTFDRAALAARGELYRQMTLHLWSPARLIPVPETAVAV